MALYVKLRKEEQDQLRELAQRERRSPREQAEYLIAAALQEACGQQRAAKQEAGRATAA